MVLAALSSAGCGSWDRQRTEFVEPFNRFLHRDFPRAIQSRDLPSVLGFYGGELKETPGFVERKRKLLDRFARIDYADDVIEEMRLAGGEDRVEARLSLRVRGVAPAGELLSIDREDRIVCRRSREGWRIVEEKPAIDELILSADRPIFQEDAEARGIRFVHESGGVMDRWGRIQNYAAGTGLAAGDYDGDGYDDLYLVNGRYCRLYRNKGDGTFEDVTTSSGASKSLSGEGRYAVFGDYDNDGDEDLFVGILDAPSLLLVNNGDGTFTDRAEAAGLRPTENTTGACWADFNRDGHLDLFIINGGNLLRHDPAPMHNAMNATPDTLYMSNGDGTFTDRTAESGTGHTGWALTVAAQDYDLDGDEDIFIGNDIGFSVLYQNQGDATFKDVSFESGVTRRGTGMGGSWGDPNGDGYPDLFVTGMASNSVWIVDLPDFPVPMPWWVNLFLKRVIKDVVKEMFDGNWYYVADGKGGFTETAASCGVRNSGWGWGGTFLDYDNDGREDIYVLNGFISGPDTQDL